MARDRILSVVFLYLALCFLCWLPAGYSEIRLTQQSPLDLPCSGAEVVFQCTLPGGVVIWSFPAEITLVPTNNEVVSGNFRARPVGVANGEFTSTLTFPANNETVIICSNGERNMNDTLSVTVRGPPSVPTLSCADLSGDVSGAVNVTVHLSGGDSADFYLINITTNAPRTPHDGFMNVSTTNVTLTGFQATIAGEAAYEYNITVRGVNCISLVGIESEPLPITPQVPNAPSGLNISAIYNQSEMLLSITITWETVPNTRDPCPDLSGNITHYRISFLAEDMNIAENMDMSDCVDGRCRYSINPTSSLSIPSSYSDLSVAAENVLGMGMFANSEQIINTTNDLLVGEVVDVSSSNEVTLDCTFLSGFNGSARCTVQYGTDPTYMNLPYSAESTETGTAGDSVSVVLREQLNSSTDYYFNLSAVSGDVNVVVLAGPFRTNCNVTDLGTATQDETVDSRCIFEEFLNSLSISGGVICYNQTTVGSGAVCICNDTYTLMEGNEATRVCQSDGNWNGSIPRCIPEGPICNQLRLLGWHIGLIVVGAIALAVAIVMIIINGIVVSCMGDCYGSKCCAEEGEDCCGSQCCADEVCHQIACIVLLVVATIFCVTGVALWIAVGVVVPNPPNVNFCDPSWRINRDGLIGSAFVASILALIFAVVWVLVHWLTSGRGEDETDGHSEKSKKTRRPAPEGSEEKVELKDAKLKKEEEEPQYSTTQHFSTSPVPLLSSNPEYPQQYSQLGEHGETGGGDIYNKPIHGGHPHAVPNPADPNYSHFKEGEATGEGYNRVQRGPPPRAVPNPRDPSYSHFPEGASRPPAEALQYDVVGTDPRYKPKPKEEEEAKGKKKGRK